MPALTDTVSALSAPADGYTYCGDRSYSITTTPSTYYSDVLSLDTSTDTLTLGLVGTTFGLEGTYTIEVTASLTLYPTVTSVSTFTATVSPCDVTHLAPTSIAAQYYDVYTP